MKITLVNNQQQEQEIDVDPDLILEAPMIQYQGTFYLYSSSQANKGYRPKFVECKAPVTIV